LSIPKIQPETSGSKRGCFHYSGKKKAVGSVHGLGKEKAVGSAHGPDYIV